MALGRVRPVAVLGAALVVVVLTPGRASAAATREQIRPQGGPDHGGYVWPVRGPVISPFEPPSRLYGPGHRGIDIAAPVGSPLRAAGPGVVAFAGWVAGSLFISIDHPDGVRTTYSWLSAVSVSRGDRVGAGQPIGATGSGHPTRVPPHLHFGARVGDVYIDPLLLLGGGSLVGMIHLAPLEEPVLVGIARLAIH
ncbi:MAG: murein hydrolase activator EnvC family protein [Actinomycetota bacterium]